MLLQAFTLGLNIGNKEITDKFKETLNEATSAQKEGDMIDAFLSESEFSALVTPGDAPCPTSMTSLNIDISKAGVV
jgi:hypothetical protein